MRTGPKDHQQNTVIKLLLAAGVVGVIGLTARQISAHSTSQPRVLGVTTQSNQGVVRQLYCSFFWRKDSTCIDYRLSSMSQTGDALEQNISILSPRTETGLTVLEIQAIKGEKGDKGDPGANGVNGIDGKPGQPGGRGAAGSKGDKGDKGDQGLSGNGGAKGDKGDSGPAGANGASANYTAGPGIVISANTISSTFGAAIDNADLTDGTIEFAKIASNSCVNGQVISFNGSGWECGNVAGVGAITLSVGTGGSDIGVTGSPAQLGETLTLNIPDAGSAARGVVSTGTQTFAGAKTFANDLTTSGNLNVNGGDVTTSGTTLSLKANGSGAGTVQVGSGAGSATPDLFRIDLKTGSSDPAGSDGAMYYNSATGKFRCYEGGAWENCVFRSTDSAQNLTLARIGNSTFSTLQDMQNVFHSAGWTSGGAITDAGGGTVNISGGTGLLRDGNTAVSKISYFDWAGQTGIAIPSNSTRYIGVEYNGGSPQISVRASNNWNLKTDFPIGVVVNEGGTLSIFTDYQAVGDHAANMIQREYETMPLSRDERNGGLILGETGTRNLTLTAGAVWDRLNRYDIPALNTSIAGNFDAYYSDGSSGFTKVSNLTQWPNTSYDNGSGTLATLTDGYYGTLWFYLNTSGRVQMLYGSGEYVSSSQADAEMAPMMLPNTIMASGKLIGKLVFQKSAASAAEISSSFSMPFSSALSANHANLSGLDFVSSGHTGFANSIAGVNDNITSMTALTSLTPSSALTITAGGASDWRTSAGALSLDAAAALNLGTTTATSINIGQSGSTTTQQGNLSVVGDFSTPMGAVYATTGTQNNVNLGVGGLFRYTGASDAVVTGIAGGTDGKFIRIVNVSNVNITFNHQDTNSAAANRIITTSGGNVVISPSGSIGLQYDATSARWRVVNVPANAASISGFAFLQNGNSFGTPAVLGTTDANGLNLITGGANRFGVAAGSSTLTGTGATTVTSTNSLSLSSADGLALNAISGTTGALNLDSGTTGAINVGTSANAKTITIGNGTGATTLNLTSGSGGINLAGDVTITDGHTFTSGTGIFTTNSNALTLAGNSSVIDMTGTGVLGLNTTTNRAITTGTGMFTAGGGLTISGDKLYMATNALGSLLVSDGTNFNPVLLSGDASIAANGALTINYASAQSADATHKGFLTAADWSTFSGKQDALGYTAENVANKSTDVAADGTSDTKYPSVKAVKTYTDNLSLGLNWQQPVELVNVVGDTSTPVTCSAGNNLDGYIINTGGATGVWSSFAVGDLVQCQTLTWVKIKSLVVGDRLGVAFKSSTTPSGGLAGKKNNRFQVTGGSAGAFTYTFSAPANNDALFVQNVNAYYHNVSFVYSSSLTSWVQLSASTDYQFSNGVAASGNNVSLGVLTSDWAQTGAFDINTNGNIHINNGKGLTVAGDVSVLGNLITPKGADYSATGVQDNISFGNGSLFNFTGANNLTITGIAGGTDGRFIRIVNASTKNIVLKHQDVNSLASNRVISETGADVTILPDSSFEVSYDASASRWRVTVLPANIALLDGGSTYGQTVDVGTNDAYALNLRTNGLTRFSVAAGSTTLTGTGATAVTTDSSLALSSAAGSALTITAGGAGGLSLDTGTTGAISIGTGANAKTITIGNGTGATTLNLTSGSGGINLAGDVVITDGHTFSTGTGSTTINGTTLTLAGNSTVIDMTGTGVLGLNTTTNRAITTGTGTLTAGGNVSVNGDTTLSGNFITPRGTDYTTTGTQNDVNLGSGSYFMYTGAGPATFTGLSGGTNGRLIRLLNDSGSVLTLSHMNINSAVGNRIKAPNNSDIIIAAQSMVSLIYDSIDQHWHVVSQPVSAASVQNFAFLNNGNGFGTTAVLGTTDANGLNFITGGSTRFGIAAGSATLTGSGATAVTSTGALSLDATTGVSLGTSTATSVAIGKTGVTTTNNGALTSAQTLTASNGLTLTTGALNLTATSGFVDLSSVTLSNGSPLVFDGATADANRTTFVITNPTAARTITFPNNSLTVNAAADISGTTLASNVTGSSLTGVGALSSGSIGSGFGSITTTNNITTSGNISSTGTGTVTSSGTLTASNGLTLTTGVLNLTATSGTTDLHGVTLSNGSPLVFDGATADANKTTFVITDPTAARTITFPNNSLTVNAAADISGTTLASNVTGSSLTGVGTLTSGALGLGFSSINAVPIGATTASTGKFTTFTTTGATDLANAGASNVTIATTGTGNVTIGNSTGTFALTSNGGLNVTTAGALTGVSSVNTITASATGLTFAGAGTISSTTTSALTLDSGTTGDVNLGTGTGGKNIAIGGTGANVITIGNTQTAGSISLGAAMTGGTISIGGTGAQTGDITIGGGTGTQTINLGTGGTGVKTIRVGDGAVANVVTVGSTTGAAATTIQSGTGNIKLEAGGSGVTGRVQIGGTAGATPDLLVLDTKNTSGDPTGVAGAMYYNSNTNKFRCFENGAWANCITSSSSTTPNNIKNSSVSGAPLVAANKTNATATSLNITTGANQVWVSASLEFDKTAATAANESMYIYRDGTACNVGGTQLGTTYQVNIRSAATDKVVAAVNFVESSALTAAAHTYRLCVTTSAVGTVTRASLTAMEVILGADLAELYGTNDQSIVMGDVVSVDPTIPSGVRKSTGSYDAQVIGVVSTLPGILMGGGEKPGTTAVPVALGGRIPVKVSAENGPIKAGDYLTTSSTPGVAMKAVKAGPIIGMAMTDFQGTEVQGTVMTYVKTGYFNGARSVVSNTTTQQQAGLALLGQLTASAATASNGTAIANNISTTNQSELVTDRVIAGLEIVTPKVTAQDLVVTGVITADTIRANHIEGLEILTNKLSLMSEQVKGATSAATVSSTTSPAPGNSTISSNILDIISQKISSMFHSLVEFFGRVIFHSDAKFLGRATFNNDTAGFAVVRIGATEVEITFDQEYQDMPIVISSPDSAVQFAIKEVTTRGFKIQLSQVEKQDVKFSWSATAVNNAKTFVGAASSPAASVLTSPSPTPVVSASPSLPVNTPVPTPDLSSPVPTFPPVIASPIVTPIPSQVALPDQSPTASSSATQ